MIITNLPDIPNRNYDILGIVEGSVAYSKHFGKDFAAGLKNMVGGELKSYTELIDGGKKIALDRLEEEAREMGADAILNIEYSLTNLQQGLALVVNVIGTAIKFK